MLKHLSISQGPQKCAPPNYFSKYIWYNPTIMSLCSSQTKFLDIPNVSIYFFTSLLVKNIRSPQKVVRIILKCCKNPVEKRHILSHVITQDTAFENPAPWRMTQLFIPLSTRPGSFWCLLWYRLVHCCPNISGVLTFHWFYSKQFFVLCKIHLPHHQNAVTLV